MTPPLAVAPVAIEKGAAGASTLEEYLALRKWPHVDEPAARRLVSAALSFPLTLAHFSTLVASDCGRRAVTTATCIGARAEATLPTALWHELALATGRDWALEMVGPHVLPNSPPRSSGRVTLTSVAALYHDVATGRPRPDLFCLFNPGMGQPEWAASWRPTVRLALATGRPLLCTAFSQRDLDADVAFLRDLEREDGGVGALEWIAEPAPNPFASRRRLVAPAPGASGAASEHVVQTNWAAFVVRSSGGGVGGG
jgi:hypothetical protein